MAAVGDYDSVLPFQALGVEPFVVAPGEEGGVDEILRRLSRSGCAVVFLTEGLFLLHRETVEELNEKTSLSVLPLPGAGGSKGSGFASVRRCVERAVGMDIFAVR
jgi:V/A-type H+-transporting ATPase subunit F